MAILTAIVGPGPSKMLQRGATIIRKFITGTGDESTELAPVVSGKAHMIVAGRLSCNGPDRVDILSNTTVLDSLQYPARTTLTLPEGLVTVKGQALKLQKAGSTTSVRGWVDIASL